MHVDMIALVCSYY